MRTHVDLHPASSRILWLAFALSLAACARTPLGSREEIVIFPARKIVTLDPRRPRVEAVAIAGDSILATGGLEELKVALRERSFTIDRRFEDRVLVPGFINQHEHAWLAAIAMIAEIVSIEDWVLPDRTIPRAVDENDYRRRLEALADRHAEKDTGDVLYTWGYHQLFHGELSRSDLDEIDREIPIVVLQRSMHEMIFNTRALERFGINADRVASMPEPARRQTDLRNGHFWEQGLFGIVPLVFPDLLAPKRYLPALERVERYWHAAGSTLVAEPGGLVSPALKAMQNRVLGDPETPFRMFYIADGKTLTARHPASRVIAETEKLFDSAEGMTRFLPKQVKLFADGAMYSQLMQMRDGYLDGHRGEWLMQPDDFEKAFRIYWDAGYQIHVHQNGDAGLDLVLDTLEANLKRTPRRDHRTVIVHFGFSRPDQVERIARLGAIVSANPFYPVVLANRYSEVGIGPERAREMVRLGDVVRAGIPLSLHSDMPMAPGRPLLLVWSAVNRRTVDGNVVAPEQRIDPERALRAVTIEAARSLRMEDRLGTIEPGKLANMTVLAENPLDVDPETIKDIPVWGTIHEGRVLPVGPNRNQAGESRSPTAIRSRNPASDPESQNLAQAFSGKRLQGDIRHARSETPIPVFSPGVGGERDDRKRRPSSTQIPDPSGRFVAIHPGHLTIHEDEIEVFLRDPFDRFASGRGRLDGTSDPFEHLSGDQPIDPIVVDDENAGLETLLLDQ